jgi:hypothetical protein
MSGPKVVRIVTREEILEICQGHLARVDAALAEWTRIGRRNDCVGDEEVAAAGRRRDALAALIASDRFMDLQKQAAAEEAFLKEDIRARLAQVAAAQAAERSKRRRELEAGRSLLRTLRTAGSTLDPELEAGLDRGDAQALSAGFQLLSVGVAAPSASRELAARFREAGSTRTFSSWLASQPAAPADPAVERIDVRLDELSALLGSDETIDWRSRLEQAAHAELPRRGLLLDGLEVETGRALTNARRRSALLTELALLSAELNAAGVPGQRHEQDMGRLDAPMLEGRLTEARAALEGYRAARAAAARRAAVLAGLAGLGYEVSEGMSTTFAQDGRLVLRSAARPDYGVEVSSVGAAERMQMRAVAFEAGGHGPDPMRDRDAETIWCGDVSTLQERLAEVGGGLHIERALAIGATPLKRVVIDGASPPPAAAAAPVRRERTIR